MHMGVHFVQALVVLMEFADENSTCCAPRQTCAEVKLEAKSVVANLWIQMEASCRSAKCTTAECR